MKEGKINEKEYLAKYADEIDFDSLPDPDVYMQKRYVYESYKAYMRLRHKKGCIEKPHLGFVKEVKKDIMMENSLILK